MLQPFLYIGRDLFKYCPLCYENLSLVPFKAFFNIYNPFASF